MRKLLAVLALFCLSQAVRAGGERAGEFDYYVLSLSWSAGWCALEGDARDDPQCDRGRGLTFVLHGLWPQYEDGWPSYCRTAARDPGRAETAVMADVMGGAGQPFHQWKKHGRCSGLAAGDYYRTAREAFESVVVPELFFGVDRPLTLPAAVIEAAFLEANPALSADSITITCKAGLIQETRICLTPELEPRACGRDVARDCRLPEAVLEPVR